MTNEKVIEFINIVIKLSFTITAITIISYQLIEFNKNDGKMNLENIEEEKQEIHYEETFLNVSLF